MVRGHRSEAGGYSYQSPEGLCIQATRGVRLYVDGNGDSVGQGSCVIRLGGEKIISGGIGRRGGGSEWKRQWDLKIIFTISKSFSFARFAVLSTHKPNKGCPRQDPIITNSHIRENSFPESNFFFLLTRHLICVVPPASRRRTVPLSQVLEYPLKCIYGTCNWASKLMGFSPTFLFYPFNIYWALTPCVALG